MPLGHGDESHNSPSSYTYRLADKIAEREKVDAAISALYRIVVGMLREEEKQSFMM